MMEAAAERQALMDDFLDTTSYVGDVRPWRDVLETDTSEDEPDGDRLLNSARNDENRFGAAFLGRVGVGLVQKSDLASGDRRRFLAVVASKRDATPLHRAADAHYRQVLLVISAAFMRGRKALRGSLRSAGDVEGHEFHGNQWTSGSSSAMLDKAGQGAVHEGRGTLLDAREGHLYRGFGFQDEESAKQFLDRGDLSGKGVYGATTFFSPDPDYSTTYMRGKVGVLVEIHQKGLETETQRRGDTVMVKGHVGSERVTRLAIIKAQPESSLFGAYTKAVIDKPMLRGAASAPNISANISAAISAIRASLLHDLPAVLLKVMQSGGEAGLGMLKRMRGAELRTLKPQVKGQPHDVKPPFGLAFNVADPKAVKWAKEHAAELAKDLSETSEQAIKDAVARAMEGDGLDAVWDEIMDAVGSEARADVIARTEIMTAANEGNRQGWVQAVDEGLLPEDAQVEWIATSGACAEICEPLDGTTRLLDGEYENEDGGGGPPAHPNCRCTEGIAG